MDSENTTYWLLYKGVCKCLGKWRNEFMRFTFYAWLEETGATTCALCHVVVKPIHRSCDHIIPQSICLELELPWLLFDTRNFRLAHVRCNARRANHIDDLPLAVIHALDKRRQEMLAYT